MTYMALIYGPPMPTGYQPSPESYKAWLDYTEATRAAGVYVDAHRLDDVTTATTVTVRDGKRVTTDGPFAETKEVLGGFYIFNCAHLDKALDWAAKCPGAIMGGKIEIRPTADM